MVQYLVLECGASITVVSTAGLNVLHTAAIKGNTTLVRWLVEVSGASAIVTNTNHIGWTALLLAANWGQYGATQYLLEEGDASIMISEFTDDGRSLWHALKLELEGRDTAALSSLLKIMVMLEDSMPLSTSLPSCLQQTPSSPRGAGCSGHSCRHTWSSSGQRSLRTALCPPYSTISSPRTLWPRQKTCGRMVCASKHLEQSGNEQMWWLSCRPIGGPFVCARRVDDSVVYITYGVLRTCTTV